MERKCLGKRIRKQWMKTGEKWKNDLVLMVFLCSEDVPTTGATRKVLDFELP